LVRRITAEAFTTRILFRAFGDLVHGKRGRGARDIEDRFDALLVEPLPGQRAGKVDLVLMVGEDDLYRRPNTSPPKSSTAMRTAVTVPWPPTSA
jgi:hypothetical protein